MIFNFHFAYLAILTFQCAIFLSFKLFLLAQCFFNAVSRHVSHLSFGACFLAENRIYVGKLKKPSVVLITAYHVLLQC